MLRRHFSLRKVRILQPLSRLEGVNRNAFCMRISEFTTETTTTTPPVQESLSTETHPESPQTPSFQGPSEDPTWIKSVLWFENVFPLKGGIDPRTPFIERFAANYVKNLSYKILLPEVFPDRGEFKVKSVEPNLKEGGLYVEFKYKGGPSEEAVEAIKSHLRQDSVRSYFNFQRINCFEVKGRPWVEDLVSRVPSSRLHVEFIKGPDLTVESLYREFRVFGRIVDINLQKSSDKEIPRYASVQFLRKRAATSARNCIHGETFEQTQLAIGYERDQGWWYKTYNWVNSNLRVSIFLFVGAFAGFSFLVFDPWREFSVTNQITGRYSLQMYTNSVTKMFEFCRQTIRNLFSANHTNVPGAESDQGSGSGHWSERKQQTATLLASFKQTPETMILITGPKGSGKTAFVNSALETQKYKLVIRCDDLIGKGDYHAITTLSKQTNFFPGFGFVSQISGFVDTLITATTGAKANLATTNDAECRKVLECVTHSLQDITERQIVARTKLLKELNSAPDDSKVSKHIPDVKYPVIVIEDFLGKENVREHYIYDLLAQWAAQVSEYRLAHVVFVSERQNLSLINKYAPSKTMELFHLSDATPAASLSYIKNRLGANYKIDDAFEGYLKSLGGRLHDLDNFVSKISSGLTPLQSFEDMRHRAIAEVRKIGFTDDAKAGFSNIQFFKVVQLLAKKREVQIDDLAADSLFGNDTQPIHSMERAGLITLVHKNERPYVLKPAKPIFSMAFKEMVKDAKLNAFMGVLTCKQLISDANKKIDGFEKELVLLNSHTERSSATSEWWWFSDPIQSRNQYLISQIGETHKKVAILEQKQNGYKELLKL